MKLAIFLSIETFAASYLCECLPSIEKKNKELRFESKWTWLNGYPGNTRATHPPGVVLEISEACLEVLGHLLRVLGIKQVPGRELPLAYLGCPVRHVRLQLKQTITQSARPKPAGPLFHYLQNTVLQIQTD